jgi:hypothetical protein
MVKLPSGRLLQSYKNFAYARSGMTPACAQRLADACKRENPSAAEVCSSCTCAAVREVRAVELLRLAVMDDLCLACASQTHLHARPELIATGW